MGNMKTGSTYLQNFLYKNREKLEENGISYTGAYEAPFYSHVIFSYALLRETLENMGLIDNLSSSSICRRIKDETERLLAQMLNHALNKSSNTIIISHEGLFSEVFRTAVGLYGNNYKGGLPDQAVFDTIAKSLHERLNNILKSKFDKISIIIYLRRQDEYVKSMYNQYMKAPWPEDNFPHMPSFDELYMRYNQTLSYKSILDLIKSSYPSANLTVYGYNPIDSNVQIHDVLRIAGADTDRIEENYDMPGANARNSSLSRQMLQFIHRFVPPEKAFDPEFLGKLTAIGNLTDEPGDLTDTSVDMSDKQKTVLSLKYSGENAIVNRLYISDKNRYIPDF